MTALTQDRNSAALQNADTLRGNLVTEDADASALQVLGALCRSALVGRSSGLADALAGMDSPEAFVGIVHHARLWSVCEVGFGRSGVTAPSYVALHARAARGRAMLVNTRVMGLARLAFPCLARHDIRTIAFKGPFQQRQLYGDCFSRPSNDLDLLVPRARFNDALAALEALDFSAHHATSQWWKFSLGEVHLISPNGGVIDLHHLLQQPGCPAPRDLDEFFEAATVEHVGQTEIAIPTTQHALLISALNFCKELFYRKSSARYAFDFASGALSLPPATHEEFAALVQRQGLEGPVGFTIAACERLFGPLPGMPATVARRSGIPHVTEDKDFVRLVFAPQSEKISWPRRRTLLWQLCGGEVSMRCSREFAAQAGRIAIAEMLRCAAPNTAGKTVR